MSCHKGVINAKNAFYNRNSLLSHYKFWSTCIISKYVRFKSTDMLQTKRKALSKEKHNNKLLDCHKSLRLNLLGLRNLCHKRHTSDNM